jgi:hypothetical protein
VLVPQSTEWRNLRGQAVSRSNTPARHYALTACGIGIAAVSNNKHGKLPMHKFYCEPEFKGSNNGLGIA